MPINCLSPVWLQRVKGIPWKAHRMGVKKIFDVLFPVQSVGIQDGAYRFDELGFKGRGESAEAFNAGFTSAPSAGLYGYTSWISRNGEIEAQLYRLREDGLAMFGTVRVGMRTLGYEPDLRSAFHNKRAKILGVEMDIEKALKVWLGETAGFNACRCSSGNPCPEHPGATVANCGDARHSHRYARFRWLRKALPYVQRYASERGYV